MPVEFPRECGAGTTMWKWPRAASSVGSSDREAPGPSQTCEVSGLCPWCLGHLCPSPAPVFMAPASRVGLLTQCECEDWMRRCV